MEKPKNWEEIHHNYTNSVLDSMKIEPVLNLQQSEIRKFFEGSNILVTGASGFVGTLLIEKLLRSCPKITKIYMLFRAKKGKTPEQRLKEHFNNSIYNRLWREQPHFMKQIELIEGDTSLNDLGMSFCDREKLIENVDIVFHGAATVRFDETLENAVNINVRGTKLIMELAEEMKNLKVFVHVSTAFAHCTSNQIEEKFYKPSVEADQVLSIVDVLGDDLLEHLTPKIIGKYPNTYAFTKALGEEIVRQKSVGIPTCIVRPSIMVATNKEPIPGWINNFYGATGAIVGVGYGLIHTLHCDKKLVAEVIPADYVINNMIAAAWDTAVQEEIKKSDKKIGMEKEPLIFNAVSSCQNPFTWGQILDYNMKHGSEIPPIKQVWNCYIIPFKHLWMYKLFAFFAHTIPGIMIDFLAILIGQKPVLSKIYQKINKFSDVISYFCCKEWKFNNDNTLALWSRMKPVDRQLFNFNIKDVDWYEFTYNHLRGLRVFLGHESPSNLKKARARTKWLTLAHYTYAAVILALLAWFLLNFIPFLFYFLINLVLHFFMFMDKMLLPYT